MKHYGEYLAFKGRAVEWASDDIARKMTEKYKLEQQLETLKSEIVKMEMEFADLIREDWTQEEIKDAQQRAYEYNNSIRIKITGYE